jgi:predicted deacylase
MLVNGVRGVMAHLKMTPPAGTPVHAPVWIEKVVTIAAEQDGVFHPLVDRDARVVKGAKIGVVTDYLNRQLQEIVAPDTGIILFVRALPSLKKGDTIANVGLVQPAKK